MYCLKADEILVFLKKDTKEDLQNVKLENVHPDIR